MAQSYTRQSSIADGDTITAALFNNEYNQLLNAFSYSSSSASSTGHRHDGSAGQGGNVPQIGDLDFLNKVVVDSTNNRVGFFVEVSSSAVEQIRVQDGAIVPVTDNDIDLGTSSLEFKDGYFDGTVYADAINFNGTAISATAAELNIMDGVTATAAELNILDGVTSTAAELNILDGVTSTAAELNILDGVTSTAAELNILDGVTASATDLNLIDGITNGTVIASKAIITDSNKDITGGRNITISGELDAATLDISGDADIDGTLEADAITIAGVTLAETISDTVGAMVSSNTETNITVTYEDSDNTLDFVIGTLNQDTTGTAALATTVTLSANNSTDETIFPVFADGATGTQGLETDTGFTYNPSSGKLTATEFVGNIDAVDGDFDGTLETDALSIGGTTVTSTAAELNILDGVTSTAAELNILDGVTASATDLNLIDGITNGTVIASKAIVTDSNKDISGGRNITISGELDAATLDISGDADIDGTLEADAITVNGTALASVIAGTTVTLASTATVSDSTANTNFPVVFHDESNALLDDTGALRYNPSTGTLLVPNLNVAGTTTQVDTVTMEASNAIIFEGATSDAHETTLTVVDPTGDRTIGLPNVSGTLPVLAAASTTQITSTPEELNILDGVTSTAAELNILDGVTSTAAELNILDGVTSTAAELNILDGVTSTAAELNILDGVTATATELNFIDGGATVGTTAVADGDGIIHNDNGTMKVTSAATFKTYFQAGLSSAADDLQAGDAAVTLTTSSGNITIDAAANDSDIIFKGTDNSSDITMLTLDGSDAGSATFNDKVTIGDGKLVLNSTAVTSTGAELNILDGVTSTAAELNILDGVTSTAAELNILDGVTSTAAELNIMDGGTSATSTTLADADRVVVNDAGTMKQVALTDFDARDFEIVTSAPTDGTGKKTGFVWYVV